MATILSLKRRIQAAQNVSKTTRAMQMIAASKLRRAQEATLSSRPYVNKITQLSRRVANNIENKSLHPYLRVNENNNQKLVVIFSPDKGLCGGLTTNLVKETLTYDEETIFIVVGKKIEHSIARFNKKLLASFPFGNVLPPFSSVYPILTIIEDYFLSQKVQSVKIVSTHFTSVFSQKPVAIQLLPLAFTDGEPIEKDPIELFEPSVAEMLPQLLSRYVEISIYQQMLESFLSEQAARMLAMQNATNNAKDIIIDLKLEYNKTRQAKITSEILDISSGSFGIQYA